MIDNDEVYITIWSDRHSDTEVYPFATEDAAMGWTKTLARGLAAFHDCDDELTDAMQQAGWLYYCRYSSEGDNLRVVKRRVRP